MSVTATAERVRATIRKATFDDYNGIARLERQYLNESKPLGEWRHLWTSNPVYQNNPDWPIGWVVEDANREIVGHIGNVPLSYELNGRHILTATARALVVERDYRAYSLPLLTCFFTQRNVDLFVNTSVNSSAAKAYKLFRTEPVPCGVWDQATFWITERRGFAASILAMRGWRSSAPLTHALALGLAAKYASIRKKPAMSLDRVSVTRSTGFDHRFDAFWTRLRRDRPQRLLASRSRETLDWHFNHKLTRGDVWVATVEKGNGLAAYAVFYRQDNPSYRLKRLRLADFQALDDNNALLGPIVSWALQKCREQGIHMLESIGFSPEKQCILDSFGPQKRQLPCWLYFYKTNDRDLGRILRNPQVWDPSCFDGDASL